jgi:ArsR family transcriptional regulator
LPLTGTTAAGGITGICPADPVPCVFMHCWLDRGFDIGQYRWMSKSQLPVIREPGCTFVPLVREPLSPEAAAQLAATLKALSDPVRLRLLSVVASHEGGEACVCDLSAGIELTQPTISHHLKVLRTAGLLDSERRASWVYYRVNRTALQQLSQLLEIDTPAPATQA